MLLHVIQHGRCRRAILEHLGPGLRAALLLKGQRHGGSSVLATPSASSQTRTTGRAKNKTAITAHIGTSATSGGSSRPSWSMRTQDCSQIVIGRLRSARPSLRHAVLSSSVPPCRPPPPPA